MEAAGAVFLPAAGYRFVVHATNVFEVGSYGYYWSSSPFDEYNAYYMNFYSHDLYAASGNNRVGGFAVRPVRDNN